MDCVGAVFEAAPALKFAEGVELYWPDGSTSSSTNPEPFLHNFAGMKTLRLSLAYDLFRRLSWTFLRKEAAAELRLIKVAVSDSGLTGGMSRSVEKLVRTYVTLPHLQSGEALELDFSSNSFHGTFGLQIIEVSTRNFGYMYHLCSYRMFSATKHHSKVFQKKCSLTYA